MCTVYAVVAVASWAAAIMRCTVIALHMRMLCLWYSTVLNDYLYSSCHNGYTVCML